MPTLQKTKEIQAHQVLIIDSHPHTSRLIPALSELREILGHTVSFLPLNVSEFILENQIPLIALSLE